MYESSSNISISGTTYAHADCSIMCDFNAGLYLDEQTLKCARVYESCRSFNATANV